MKKIIRIMFVFGALTTLSTSGICQGKNISVKELKIGDTIPDLQIERFVNSKAKRLKVSELYKGGLLIINFWATWCAPCIKELPLLDSMKNIYPDKLNVLSVAYEDSIKIKGFLRSHRDMHLNNLLITTNDTLFGRYFPHKTLPHNIWIDNKGIVRAITSAEEMSEKNITAFINKRPAKLSEKRDRLNFNNTKPFHLGDSIFQYRSIFTKYIDGIQSGCNSWGSHKDGMTRIFAFNYKIVDLFTIAQQLNPISLEDYNLIEIHTKDSIKFFRPEQIKQLPNRDKYQKRVDWERDNLYCYDLTLPYKVSDTLFYRYMMNDLQRMFNVSCREEQRVKTCNVVTNFSGSKYALTNYHSNHDTTKVEFFKGRLLLQRATLKDLVRLLDGFEDRDAPWVDETGITFPVDLEIHFDITKPITMNLIKETLKEYGLNVNLKTHKYPVMVLEDLTVK